ncbi:excinuclease ABC subunit UvrA [Micromonospora sp. PTRAS2]
MPAHTDLPTTTERIEVRGARTHNLRDINVTIPRNRIVAFTGVSGSGKTSLAIDTVHAEAQLRYLEGITPFVRQFITPKDRPIVDEITGLGATLAVDQRRLNRSARSSVGTLTGLDNYLSLLYSRLPGLAAGSDAGLRALTPAHFDRFAPEGHCPVCKGAGATYRPTAEVLFPHPGLPLYEGASPWFAKAYTGEFTSVRALAERDGVDLDRPWQDLPVSFRDAVLHGTGDAPVEVLITGSTKKSGAALTIRRNDPLRGAIAEVQRLFDAAGTEGARERYLPFLERTPCPDCAGSGYGPVANEVRLAGLSFPEVTTARIRVLTAWAQKLGTELTGAQHDAAQTLLPGLVNRLDLLDQLGLGHLQLERTAVTMSGGELQRTRVAAQLSTPLSGIIFVLDEPSSGLHPADKAPLLAIIERLRDAGNTVLLIEHDPELIGAADWIIDLGPAAGRDGGRVVAAGPPAAVAANPDSVTGRYLARRGPRLTRTTTRPVGAATDWLTLSGVAVHNVRVEQARIPLRALTCITGVSGSGKSSLLHAALAVGVAAALEDRPASAVREITGTSALTSVTVVNQDPIGRTPRSNPATYTKAFDVIRALFAATPAAKNRKLTAGTFSPNSAGGRCEACTGYGKRLVDMQFLPNTWVTCEVCQGRRFTEEVLRVTYQGLALDEVLNLTVEESYDFFHESRQLRQTFDAMRRAGLGYLRLGQPAVELSGGEAQRLKLANALLRSGKGSGAGLVVLDEPVTGLHPSDIQRIVDAIDALLAGGNTVVVAEHDLHLAAVADHVVDMGPGGGEDGGRIVNEGTPAQVAGGSGPTAHHLGLLLQQ